MLAKNRFDCPDPLTQAEKDKIIVLSKHIGISQNEIAVERYEGDSCITFYHEDDSRGGTSCYRWAVLTAQEIRESEAHIPSGGDWVQGYYVVLVESSLER